MLRFEGNSPAAGKDDKNTASLSKQHLGKRPSSDNTAATAAASTSSSSESGEGSEQEQQHRSSKHQSGKKKIKSSHLPIYEEYQPPTPEEPVAVTGSLFDPLTQPGTLSVAQRLEALEKLLQTSLAAASSKTSASSAQTLPVIPPLGSSSNSSSTKIKETLAPVASSVAKKLKTKKQLKEAAQQKINELLSLFAD